MTQTRADLDRKITELEVRAKELTPRAYAKRHMPEFMLDRVIGGVLTLVGLRMVWGRIKRGRAHRAEVREAMAAYGRW
jgi:hypothetical protein